MRGLTVEFLELGALPLYELDCRWTQTLIDLDGPPRWEPRGRFSRGRVLVQLWEDDVLLVDLRDKLTEWLGWLDTSDGSLICPIRGVHEIPETEDHEGYGPFVMAGLCFIPGVDYGWPLTEEDDPIDIIVQVCSADGVDFEILHPAVQRARAQRAEQRARWEAQRAKDEAKQRIIDTRSLKLLRDCLTPDQLAEFETYGMFHIVGGDGYTYAIERGYHGHVFRVEEGERTVSYCIHPKGNIPSYDLMLGHKLMLEVCPERFHAIANFTRLIS